MCGRQSMRGELPAVEVIVCHEPDIQRMAQALLIVLERRGKACRDKLGRITPGSGTERTAHYREDLS